MDMTIGFESSLGQKVEGGSYCNDDDYLYYTCRRRESRSSRYYCYRAFIRLLRGREGERERGREGERKRRLMKRRWRKRRWRKRRGIPPEEVRRAWAWARGLGSSELHVHPFSLLFLAFVV